MKSGKIISLVLLVVGLLFIVKPSEVGAACSDISSYGALTYSLPIVPNDSKQADLWIRVQSDNSNVRLLGEVNSKVCLELNSDIEPGKWSWITNPSDKRIELDKDVNELKLVGTQDGVRIDKVLFITDGCIPSGDGANCTSETDYVDVSGVKFKEIESPGVTISGKVSLSATPIQNSDNLNKLSYLVSGRQMQASDRPVMFDSTLLENGSHRVYIISELSTGETIREVVSVNIKNPEGPFSPLFRFMKLNKNILFISAFILSLILILLLVLTILRGRQKAKTIRRLKGLDS